LGMLSGGKKMIYSEESFAPALKYWNNTCRSIVHTKEMIGLIFLGSLSSRHQQIPHSAPETLEAPEPSELQTTWRLWECI